MNTYQKIILACIGLAVFSASVAQEKKVYRWVDKSGKVHISDQLPPEANDQARQEYNANTGSLKNSVQPQLSAKAQELARKQAEEKAYYLDQAEMIKRTERGLLSNYSTEQDLQGAFDERADLIKQSIVSTKASIQSLRAILLSSLNELNGLELNGQALPKTKIDELHKSHALILKQSAKLVRLKSAYVAMQLETAETLEKFRQSKSEQTIPTQAVDSTTNSAGTKQNPSKP
jgi:hypothetical protein